MITNQTSVLPVMISERQRASPSGPANVYSHDPYQKVHGGICVMSLVSTGSGGLEGGCEYKICHPYV